MVRHYKRKRDPRGRMLRAVELRAQGKSFREIATALGCSHDTAWRDLKKWDAENASVLRLSDSSVRKVPQGGEILTPESDSSATVIPLRKASHG